MTDKENERLAVLETGMKQILYEVRAGFEINRDEHHALFAKVALFEGFKGKMIGGAIVGGIVITAAATLIPFLVR